MKEHSALSHQHSVRLLFGPKDDHIVGMVSVQNPLFASEMPACCQIMAILAFMAILAIPNPQITHLPTRPYFLSKLSDKQSI